MNDDNFKIDFIGIGAIKAATTWIFRRLKEHPQICGSSRKEIRFFDKPSVYSKGLDYYRSFFNHCSQDKLKGEYTPEYLYYKETPKRIHETFPEVKLITCLRNPIERAYSHYRWAQLQKNRLGHYETFEEAIEKSSILVNQGLYYKQLKRYYELFPEENILVLLYDDLKKDPLSFIQSAYKFLEVDPIDFKPSSVSQKENPTGGIKYKQRFSGLNVILWNIWKKINPPDEYSKSAAFLRRIGFHKLGKKILTFNRSEVGKKNLQPTSLDNIKQKTRTKLQKTYREDINKLEQLINEDLSRWK